MTELIINTFAATTLMTLCSYLLSESFRKLYKEPVLLESLMTSFGTELGRYQKKIASWLLHYAIGMLFLIPYYLPIWMDWDWYEINWLSGIIFGCVIGAIGIAGWKIMFNLSRHRAAGKGFYLQLFCVHVIFGLTTIAVHLLFFK